MNDPDIEGDKDLQASSSFGSPSKRMSTQKQAMYPFTVHAYDFNPGDWVHTLLSDRYFSAYIGKVLHVLPKANKVVIKWPHRVTQEDPEWLVKVNKEQTDLMVTSSKKASNLVRIARELRAKGLSDMDTLGKMTQALGRAYPFAWIRGSVELAYPKKTASYSEDAQHLRGMLHFAEYVKGLEDT